MSFSTLIFGLLALTHFSIAGYVLQDDYSPSKFFSMFDFFTAPDPTHGFVKYVDQGTAQRTGLIKTGAGSVYMGVDFQNVTPGGRPSVRITSKKSYNTGLVILDLAHMPASTCGTWPAFWTVGPNWPHSGEIDIIEGVNDAVSNSMALHTGPGCGITNNDAFSGSIVYPSCDVWADNQPTNSGCSIHSKDTSTYGNGFNAVGGGVYITEWTTKYISVFHFPRGRIPADIREGRPNPATWGKPLAQFQGACNFESSFRNQQIVFDTTFCGDWAGNVWSTSTCASKAPTCNAFVQNNPGAFKDSFWTVNSLKVFTSNGLAETPEVPKNTTVPEVPTAIPTSSVIPTTFATFTSAPVSAPLSFSSFWPRPGGNATNTAPFPLPDNTTAPFLSGTGASRPPVTVTTNIYTTVTEEFPSSSPSLTTTTTTAYTTVTQAETSGPAESSAPIMSSLLPETSSPAESSPAASTTAPAVISVPSAPTPTSANPPATSTTSAPWGYFPGRRGRRPTRRDVGEHLMRHRRAHGAADLS